MAWKRGVSRIQATELPEGSLLWVYREAGAHADCYTTVIANAHSFERYVEAFYTTWLFKIERFVLRWAVRKPSSDADAARLASGAAERFAAWTVEGRTGNQLLMCDFMKRTRSWLMVTGETIGGVPSTRLFFGSAVVPIADRNGRKTMGAGFGAMLWFHHLYSIMLLRAAGERLTHGARRMTLS